MFMLFIFNGLFAIAPNYNLLMLTRFLCGLPHGAFFGVGAVVASKLADPGREARAVSVMFAGLTIANIIGVPIGTYIGHHLDWRFSFGAIAFFGLITLFSIKLWMPFIKAQNETSFKSSLKIFRNINFWLIMGICAIGTGGLFAWISYIAPLMTDVAGFSANNITIIMIIIGLGMACGNFVGGRLADRYSPIFTTGLLLLTMVLALLTLVLVIHFKVPTIVMIFLIGAIGFAVIAPLQMLIMQYAKGAEMLASSVLQATANIGNALGAFLGGLPIAAGYGYTSPQFVGAGLAFCGLLFCLILYSRSKKTAI
jgi:DHA1 family arabinose polymer transporter-like MFS transporter